MGAAHPHPNGHGYPHATDHPTNGNEYPVPIVYYHIGADRDCYPYAD
ncbi:MAG TPA: hypothetical protein VFF68_02520 [Anaerolineaceae bacterium]|nr:hypothetical protein [Anaerolineaceae bacterium]